MRSKVFSHSIQGRRDANEDNHVYFINIDNKYTNCNNINYLAVFDGHGSKTISTFLKSFLSPYIINKFPAKIYKKNNRVPQLFEHFFDIIQNIIIKKYPRVSQRSGSTACIIIQYIVNSSNYLWIFNVGDSRAIKCNHFNIAEQLTLDHKPNSPNELQRITSLNGQIQFDGFDWRINGLSLSRAFGDVDCTPQVTHKPDIYHYAIKPDDKFIVVGCDGLYDVLTNQEIVDFVCNLLINKYKHNYAKALTEYAYEKGSTDNITVIIYFF